MTREIMFADIGFRLDDASRGDAVPRATLENGAQQIARDQLGLAIVEVPRYWRR
jgi:hypothetical protein